MVNNLEFLGLPGSGKTTIYKIAICEMSRRGILYVPIDRHATKILVPAKRGSLFSMLTRPGRNELNRLPDHLYSAKFRSFSAFVERYPDFSKFVLEADETRLRPTAGSELLVLPWVLEQIWSFQATSGDNNIKGRLLLRDHGFSQLSISIFAFRETNSADLDRHLRTYFSLMPLPRFLVVVGANQQTIESRLAARGYPERMACLSFSAKKEILARAARCILIGVEVLRQRGTIVFEINNVDSLAQLEDEAVAVVGRIASSVS